MKDLKLLIKEEILKTEIQKQLNSFKKAHEKNQIFTFLEHPNIPRDNRSKISLNPKMIDCIIFFIIFLLLMILFYLLSFQINHYVFAC